MTLGQSNFGSFKIQHEHKRSNVLAIVVLPDPDSPAKATTKPFLLANIVFEKDIIYKINKKRRNIYLDSFNSVSIFFLREIVLETLIFRNKKMNLIQILA